MLLLALKWAQVQSTRSQVEPVTYIQDSGCTRVCVTIFVFHFLEHIKVFPHSTISNCFATQEIIAVSLKDSLIHFNSIKYQSALTAYAYQYVPSVLIVHETYNNCLLPISESLFLSQRCSIT